MRMLSIFAIFTILLGLCPPGLASAGDSSLWGVDNRQITLNGDPFTVQGMGYSPAPIGGDDAIVPFGDYFIDQWKSITSATWMPCARPMSTRCGFTACGPT